MGLVNLLVCVLVIVFEMGFWVSGNVVFKVHHKFSGSKNSLTVYKEHDYYRRRILSAVDLPIGGDDSPTSAALYFTKIKIGTPPRDYHVQIDTGSDLLWINCAGCSTCPKESDLGIPLALYDPLNSSSAKVITCGQEFCSAKLDPSNRNCLRGSRCPYLVSMKGRISFGCGSRQLGQLGSTQQALDGILGFGQSNSSIISQLASAKKVKKMFSHCLSGYKGGIYAIGEVVEPKVQTTPIMPNDVDYGFPVITFHFADSLQLKVYPRQYLFRFGNKDWCVGFLSNGMNPHSPKDMTLLGDILLTDKLVTYNMEDHTIGWTEYDCM
nr:aspartic proteinase-like protein 2 [Tanacetum cinerariifolium]